MHKVVVERPRRNPGPDKNGRRGNLSDELLPKYEGMKRPHRNRKGLTDLLGPLKRWLQAQVGRPWNDVYSEACAVIKPDSIIRAHIKTHLLEFVERQTLMHDGKVCVLEFGYHGRGIVPLDGQHYRRNLFFVHPETGLLQVVPRISKRARRARKPKPPVTIHWIGKNVALQQIRGLWFECHFEAVPVGVKFKAYDHALERVVSRGELPRYDTLYSLCKFKRQLSKRELGHFGLRNSPKSNPMGAQCSIGRPWGRLNTALCLSAGRRLWVIETRQRRFNSAPRSNSRWCNASTPDNSTIAFLPANFSDGPKTSGYPSLVRLQSAPPNGAVAQLVEQSRVTPCPFAFHRGVCRDGSTTTLNQEIVWQTTHMISTI
jgi:hypothetical protein